MRTELVVHGRSGLSIYAARQARVPQTSRRQPPHIKDAVYLAFRKERRMNKEEKLEASVEGGGWGWGWGEEGKERDTLLFQQNF